MSDAGNIAIIRGMNIAIAKKYLEEGKYSIKDFYLCNVTQSGSDSLHISLEENFWVAIKKIKADYLWTDETKYIIIDKKVLLEGQYPITISTEVAEAYLVSKKDKENKRIKLRDEKEIKEMQYILAAIFGIY